ncbi:hypothetical protein [Lysobacter gummosus]
MDGPAGGLARRPQLSVAGPGRGGRAGPGRMAPLRFPHAPPLISS